MAIQQVKICRQSSLKKKTPCVLYDEETNEPIGLLVNIKRFQQLAKNENLGTCSVHMAALLADVVSKQERRARIKRLDKENRLKNNMDAIRKNENLANPKAVPKKAKKSKSKSRLSRGRRGAKSVS